MRMEVCSVGRRVATFEDKPGSNQDKVESLSKKMESPVEEQGKFWNEARLAASRTDATLAEVKAAQKTLKAKQTKALRQLQRQVLQEVDTKLTGSTLNEKQKDREAQANPVPDEGEWVRRVKARPQPMESADKRGPIPTKYSDIEAKEERVRPQTTNRNGSLNLVYVRDWMDESI